MKMKQMLLHYDGTTYELRPEVASDLLARGVIVADPSEGAYELSLEHLIEEVEPFATVIERSDAPQPPRLGRLRVRGFSLFGGLEQEGFFPPTTNDLTPTKNEPRED
jgi:hypothetical protein